MSSYDETSYDTIAQRVSLCPDDVIKRNWNRLRLDTNAVVDAADQLVTSPNEQSGYTSSQESEPLDDMGSDTDVIFEGMYRLWKQERLCDVIFQTMGGHDIFAHKVALAAHSDILAKKFNSLPHGYIIDINFKEINRNTTLGLVKFLYTARIALSDHNAIETLYCARELGLEKLVAKCKAYIKQATRPHNAVLFFNYADQRKLNDIKEETALYISRNFLVMFEKYLDNFPVELLIYILESDDLEVYNELDVFEVIVRWIDYNRTDRYLQAGKLLNCIRYQFIDAELASLRIQPVEWMFSSSECWQWLFNVMKYHALNSMGSKETAKYPAQRARGHYAKLSKRGRASPSLC